MLCIEIFCNVTEKVNKKVIAIPIFVSINEASYFTQQEIHQPKKLHFLGT